MIEYNTKRNKLIIKEYGRNVQKMIEDAVAIEDRQKRNETARSIVRVMSQLNDVKDPDSKNKKESLDYWHKLWDHLFIMSNYALEVDAPFPKPKPETRKATVIKPDYNKHKIRFRTYGRNMENIIKTVSEYPEEYRNAYGRPLANHLKMMYLTYNRDSVNDKLIAHQIEDISDGRIIVPEDSVLDSTKTLLQAVSGAPSSESTITQPSKKKKKRKKKKKNNNSL